MSMTNSALIWDRLPALPPPNMAFLGIPNNPGLKWVKATESKVGIAIDLPSTLESPPGKPFRSLDFEIVKLAATRAESVFCVFCNQPGSFEIFEDLCHNLVKGLEGIQDPIARAKATIDRARAWSELFKSGRRELNREQIMGLICELEFLESKWMPLNLSVDTWFGPDRKSQDFIELVNNVAVEVKHMDSSKSIKISSLHQLEFDGRLFLVAYQLKEDSNGRSLNERIDSVLEQLEPMLGAEFETKLIRVGYEKSSSYEERFSIAGEFLYEVVNDFPRIVPGTLPGLVKASYTLELNSNVEAFLVQFNDIGDAIER